MNEVDACSVRVTGGYRGMFRKVHKSGWEAVEKDGDPVLFPTPEAAEVAAWRALKAHLCADIVRCGETAGKTRANAEELFNKIFPGGGRKPVEVVRR